MGAIAAGLAAVAVAGVASAVITSSATAAAAKDQVAAAQNQIQLQAAEFNVEQENEAPYRAAGNTALQELSAGFGANGAFTKQFTANNFQGTPQYAGYQFQQDQGNKAITAGAAATGQSLNPGTLKALSAYNQGLAATDYQSWYNSAEQQWQNGQNEQIGGLQSLAGLGLSATNQTNQAGQTATASEVASLGAIGNAQAAGSLGTAQGINQGLGSISGAVNNYGMSQYYNSLFNSNSIGNLSTPDLSAGAMSATAPAVDESTISGLASTIG